MFCDTLTLCPGPQHLPKQWGVAGVTASANVSIVANCYGTTFRKWETVSQRHLKLFYIVI